MKEIQLTQGQVAIVDDEDFEYLSQWKWFAKKEGGLFYAARSVGTFRKTVKMHRVVTGAPSDMFVDHKNRNSLDNRRSNLRVCNRYQNSLNRQAQPNNRVGLKGVEANGNKFTSRITINGKLIYLGRFSTSEEAARAYDKAARKHHREFACLNFPEEAQ